MRIISGSFKGKKISDPKDIKTRPLKDLTKESIFNIIKHSNKLKVNLSNSNVLDLFSGVGSFGIECLSRDAKKVVFVENYLIIEKDIYNSDIFLKLEDKFDIIFLDPPYRNKNLDKVLIDIDEQKILKKNGIIIVHRHKNEQDSLPKNFEITDEKKYGISKIIFLTNLN